MHRWFVCGVTDLERTLDLADDLEQIPQRRRAIARVLNRFSFDLDAIDGDEAGRASLSPSPRARRAAS